MRLITKSTPSKTGGLSSNSGTVWPGHELVPVGHDLHRRGGDPHRDAALVAAVDELERLVLREVGVGDDHLLHAVLVEQPRQLVERAEVAQAVVGLGRQRDVADRLVARGGVSVEQRVRDRVDLLARADQDRAPAAAERAQRERRSRARRASAARSPRSGAKNRPP